MNSQRGAGASAEAGAGSPSSIENDLTKILELLKAKVGLKNVQNRTRLWDGLQLTSELVQQHRNNPENLSLIYSSLKTFIAQNPERTNTDPSKWETCGLKICAVSPIFVDLFPTIKAEREGWSLLDHLQYDIIRYYYSGESTDEERRWEPAREAMKTLLAHRMEEAKELGVAMSRASGLDPILLNYFRETISLYKISSRVDALPARVPDQSLGITSRISIKLKKEADMITVGWKPGGAGSGRLKVKRIRAAAGKPTEVEKYLNRWLEKDLDENDFNESIGGVLAHTLNTGGTPKQRLLEKKNEVTRYSSINKFINNAVIADDITDENREALLSRPVAGLVSMLITSSWVLQNDDLNSGNFGLILEDNKPRFIFFDFDGSTFSARNQEEQDEFLKALNEGNISMLKSKLILFIEDDVPTLLPEYAETQTEKKKRESFIALVARLKKMINEYDERQIVEELQELISKKEIFPGSASYTVESILLTGEKQAYIQERLDHLKTSIEKFIAIRAPLAQEAKEGSVYQPVAQEAVQHEPPEETKKDPRLNEILDFLKPDASQFGYECSNRIKQGLDLAYKLACENRDQPECLKQLGECLTAAKKIYPIDRFAYQWETLGLKLCAISNIFLDHFPTIQAEREGWTLLDHLQYDILRFYHYSGESTDNVKREIPAIQAMEILLAHRLDEAKELSAAIAQEKSFDPEILKYFRETLRLYQNKSSGRPPERDRDGSEPLTTKIQIKVKKAADMITVGWKPDGGDPGRLKVKRIRATPGKNPLSGSEIGKYLNLWLEKDISHHQEPTGGVLAHTLYESGTPKARLLEIKPHTARYSSINKFNHHLILAKDLKNHPNFNQEEKPGMLLGLPVTGLISLIAICMLLKYNDFHVGNFGLVREENRMRFFLIDFGRIRLCGDEADDFLNALHEGNLQKLKDQLKKYAYSSGLQLILDELIDAYELPQIIEELQGLISNKEIFTAAQSSGLEFLDNNEAYIQRRLKSLKSAVEDFVGAQPAAMRMIKNVYHKVAALTREYVSEHSKEQTLNKEKPDSVLAKKLDFFNTQLRALEGAKNEGEMLFKLKIFVDAVAGFGERKTHRTEKWKRYLANVLSTITVIPALGRMAYSYYKYDTIKFWQPQSKKLKKMAETQWKKIEPKS